MDRFELQFRLHSLTCPYLKHLVTTLNFNSVYVLSIWQQTWSESRQNYDFKQFDNKSRVWIKEGIFGN